MKHRLIGDQNNLKHEPLKKLFRILPKINKIDYRIDREMMRGRDDLIEDQTVVDPDHLIDIESVQVDMRHLQKEKIDQIEVEVEVLNERVKLIVITPQIQSIIRLRAQIIIAL